LTSLANRPKLIAMKIVHLLVPVSERTEFVPIRRGPLAWLRNRVRRVLDVCGVGAPHFSTWQDAQNTNRGDSAIRIASLQLLRQAFRGGVQVKAIGWDEVLAVDPARVGAFVLGGGGYFGLHAGGRLAARVARDVDWLREIRGPVVSFAPGVNRALEDGGADLDDDARATLAELLGRLALSSARDANSCRLLDLVAPGRTTLLADPALFLDAPEATAHDDTVLTVGLNLAFHGHEASAKMPARLQAVAAVARDLARQRPCRFVYFVHEQPERLIPHLLRRACVPVRVVDAGPAAMLAEYRKLDVHVCQMLHSSILAFAAGVPAVAVAYDVKNAGLFELMGLPEFCLADASALAAAIADVLARRAGLVAHIAARKAALRADVEAFLASVVLVVRRKQGEGFSADEGDKGAADIADENRK
jgi:polysaccharide pyruvyl transferase WcaK-like protein